MIEVHDRDASGAIDLHPAQHGAKQLEPAHVVAVVHVARHPHRIHAGLDDLAADVERTRRDARIMKRPGVGENGQVDVRRNVHRHLHVECADESVDHLAARRRGRVEPVDGAVGPVVRMMIDIDDEVLVESFDAGPGQIAAFHDDRRVESALHSRRDDDVGDAGKQLQGRRRRVGVDNDGLFSEFPQREGHRELRSDGVAIGAGVR